MSDTSRSERERIREQKRKRLREQHGESATDTSESPSEPIEIEGRDHFETVLSEYDSVLVDCYADWCGPCKMTEPIVEDIAAEADAAVAKVDIDRHRQIAQQLGARSVPTFVLYRNGEPAERLVGAQDRAAFDRLLASA